MTVAPRYWQPSDQRAAMQLICSGETDAVRFAASGLVEVERIRHLLTPELAVLDFGGGIGRVTRHLAPLVGSVTLVDSSPEMLGFAADHCAGLDNVSFVRSAKPLPFDNGSFDLVCAYLVFFHLYHDSHDAGWWLAELHRVLKPGGLLVYDVDHATDYGPIDPHLWEVLRVETLPDWRQDPNVTGIYRTLRKVEA